MIKNRIMMGAVASLHHAGPDCRSVGSDGRSCGRCKAEGDHLHEGDWEGQHVDPLGQDLPLAPVPGQLAPRAPTTGTEGDTSGTIKWANGKSTTFSESTTAGTKCPTTDAFDELITGAVTADTTKSTAIGAAVSGEFCVTENMTTGKIKLALQKGTSFTIAK